jgi:hypothetical protein
MSEQIWFKDPAILFTKESWNKFVPTPAMDTAEALNAVVRFTVYFSVLLFACTSVGAYLVSIPAVMLTTILLHKLFPNGKVIESFLTKAKEVIQKKHTMPTKENPFMNVLLTEILDNPNREDAAPTNRRDVKSGIQKAFQQTSDLYMDTSDVFDQAQAMRTFHTLQSAKVPNDQDSFLKWMSKGMDEPDHSGTFPARNAKILSEGFVAAKGSMRSLTSSTDKPTGSTPSSPPTVGK